MADTASRRRIFGAIFSVLSVFSCFSGAASADPANPNGVIVYQTDFGLKDGAVAEMKGVAAGVSLALKQYDLTHEIPAYNIWEASYRLWQTAPYWPAGTVFVSVVDPGVGTARKSVVARTKNGEYFVTPDNGTLTLIAENLGIDALREIDETKNRRPGSEQSYTFHGRDVYSYTAARLAAGVIRFEEVGPELDASKAVKLDYQHASLSADGTELSGNIPVLDPQYGNVWTNITQADFEKFKPAPKPGEKFEVMITQGAGPEVFRGTMPYANSFGAVPEGEPLLYLNSLLNVSFAINMGNFAAAHHVASGPVWSVMITRAKP